MYPPYNQFIEVTEKDRKTQGDIIPPALWVIPKEAILNSELYAHYIIREKKYGNDYYRIWLSKDGKNYWLNNKGKCVGITLSCSRIEGKLMIDSKIVVNFSRINGRLSFTGKVIS